MKKHVLCFSGDTIPNQFNIMVFHNRSMPIQSPPQISLQCHPTTEIATWCTNEFTRFMPRLLLSSASQFIYLSCNSLPILTLFIIMGSAREQRRLLDCWGPVDGYQRHQGILGASHFGGQRRRDSRVCRIQLQVQCHSAGIRRPG